MSTIATTVYLHRSKTHRAVKLNIIVEYILQFFLWLNTGVKSKFWVIVHKFHHSSSDKLEDVHSPKNPIKIFGLKIKGPFATFVEYFFLLKPVDENRKEKMEKMEWGNSWVEKNIFYKLSWFGPVILLASYLLIFNTSGILMFAIQFLYLPIVAGGFINGLGHAKKEKDRITKDYSSNLFESIEKLPKIIYWLIYPIWFVVKIVLNFMTGGEWRHYFHHLHQNSARFTIKKWEFDIGWVFIYLLWLFNLATDIKYWDSEQNKRVELI